MTGIIFKILIVILALQTALFAKTLNYTMKSNRTIQQSIDALDKNDTLVLSDGIYYESLINISKQLIITGSSKAIIDGNNKGGTIITISSDNVAIAGITIRNVMKSAFRDFASIKLNKVSNCRIENVTLINAFFGIYLSECSYSNIIGNKIFGNSRVESMSGNGIHLWHCKGINIFNNYIENQRDGIYFEFVSNSWITNNESAKNLRYGLHFMFSDNCSYNNNKFHSNGAGVAVMYTRNVNMQHNLFYNNWGPASYGLLLKDIRDSKIQHNTFKNNTTGIYAEGSRNIMVSDNFIGMNGWAVKILASSVNITFTRNNFVSNSFNVATNSSQNSNTFIRNYWSDYSGYDLDKNGIGDVPYHPVRLFSYLVSRNEQSIFLLHSFFIDLLDLAEKVFPSITPVALIDKEPLMKQIK